MKLIRALVFILPALGVLLLTNQAKSQLTDAFFTQFQSPFLQIITRGSTYEGHKSNYPWYAKWIQSDYLKWDPVGRPNSLARNLEDDCKIDQKAIRFENLDQIEGYLKKCQSSFETGHNDIITNSIAMMTMKLHPANHPYAKHVILNLPGNIRLKAFLGLKGDGKKRPLVIFRLGIFSNTEEFFPERYLFMQMFEESPFNILVLESLSGSEFSMNNSVYSVGGFDEGIQNYYIARQLQNKQEPLSKIIDSVHMMGISFGGHGVLYSSLLNEINEKVISSFLAFCPLINMQNTFDFHRAQGFSLWAMNQWSKARLSRLNQIFPNLDSNDFMTSVLTAIEKNYHGPLSVTDIKLPASEKEDFVSRNQFWSAYHKIKSPVLVFASKKDPIVPFEVNSEKIQNGTISVADSNFKLIVLDQGFHCSVPIAYDWHAISKLLQASILMSAPHFVMKEKSISIPEGEKEWLVDTQGIHTLKSKYEFPLEQTEYTSLRKPLTEETISMLRRWVARNLQIRENREKPAEVFWQSAK